MSLAAPSCLPLTLDEESRVCTILATRLETLLRREHARVMYLDALARQLAMVCEGQIGKSRSWLARLGLMPCPITQKCVSDMAASVAMALHVMQMELLEHLSQGHGMDHPLARLLVDRLDCEHDDVMRTMRMFFYYRVDMVREGLMHHELLSKVALCSKDIERWIERQSRIADGVMVPSSGQ